MPQTMPVLVTARLTVMVTPTAILEQRLRSDSFDASVIGIGDTQQYHFPPEWPGDALGFFAEQISQRTENPDAPEWGGTVFHHADRTAIGQLGTFGMPDEGGAVTMGYGFNPAYWNKGYATEAVGVFVNWLLQQPSVVLVKADTAVTNPASARVLEKCGFLQIGTGHSDEDGDLLLWERRA